MKHLSISKILSLSVFFFYLNVFAQDNTNKFIHIEWEKNSLASEYHLQISDSVKFLDIIYQKKTKESVIRLEPNPKYRYGRIAGIDEFGVKGEYSEIFEIEQRIVEKKKQQLETPLPSNYLGENHSIVLDVTEDKTKQMFTYYKVNDGKWLTYHDGIHISKEGLNLIQYYSVDTLGNREKIKTMDYILDTTAPHIEAAFTNIYENQEKFIYTSRKSNIDLTISDLYSEVSSVKTYLRTAVESREINWDPKQSISIPVNFGGQIVELVVVAIDRLGNIRTYSKFFKHDILPPEISVESFSKMDGAARKTSIIHISAVDSFSGVNHIFYSINNSPFQTYFEPIIISDPGEYELKFYALDNIGNKSAIQYERIYIAEPVANKKNSNDKKK